ncbi:MULTISPECIES: MepB family protein [unclassified Myroides]|uniref:MepB family protein n=1 Tax=unclassified Myroides TaxID=2642485 RepID=UPI0015F88882|nr:MULTISPECIES: MepB family protein [unclassified Myroides]MBB1148581.1 MepB family protein [Myroides sp. NP-2]MDM1406294.1 MepB family protein [Myroides sp. DF42-4-2]
MPDELQTLDKLLLQRLNIVCTTYAIDPECQEYSGCSCTIASHRIIYRKAKITPKKIGQFVTVWKRNEAGITAPFSTADTIDFFIILTEDQHQSGCFIFPKAVLEQHGIITTDAKEGKRGFRVYPSWDTPTSKQALKTQQWQQQYFISLTAWNNQTQALAQSILRLADTK